MILLQTSMSVGAKSFSGVLFILGLRLTFQSLTELVQLVHWARSADHVEFTFLQRDVEGLP